jgi:hypothetical protein
MVLGRSHSASRRRLRLRGQKLLAGGRSFQHPFSENPEWHVCWIRLHPAIEFFSNPEQTIAVAFAVKFSNVDI